MSTEKDALADELVGFQIGSGYYALDVGYSEALEIADIVFAAGYRKLSDRCSVCGRLIGSNGVTCHADPKHEGYYICCVKIDGEN